MDVIEYFEKLDLLEATEKKQNLKKSPSQTKTKDSSK